MSNHGHTIEEHTFSHYSSFLSCLLVLLTCSSISIAPAARMQAASRHHPSAAAAVRLFIGTSDATTSAGRPRGTTSDYEDTRGAARRPKN
jgi:hypothetical protein